MNTTADRRLLPGGRIAAELYKKSLNRVILVVGGGPSAPAQLEQLHLENPVIIAANDHAFRLGLRPDYIVCKDHRHTETKEFMEDRLRGYGVPIVSPHYWADHRMYRWPAQGNSGQMAIGLAALLGGSPIIPIGFDCYQGGTYFHDADAHNVSRGRPGGIWHCAFSRSSLRLQGAAIRAVGGITADVFPHYDSAEVLPPVIVPAAFEHYATQRTQHVRMLRASTVPGGVRSEIPAGWILPVDVSERGFYLRTGAAELVHS